ncbi:matrix metalloproteinase-17-like [Cololabis saira]|uniref:matrix metalloproteinase-17-like n=1 Tax=Cololabis saira TaxID=129043 RepID=UPI002AD4ACFF|nr:matrix metalloproteinase-17-like [Cololabis saira]
MGGYPRPISDWGMRTKAGAPVGKVDAAFIWAHNGKTYLFGEGEFWRFDEGRKDEQVPKQPESGYPRDNSLWGGMPTHMDDVISSREEAEFVPGAEKEQTMVDHRNHRSKTAGGRRSIQRAPTMTWGGLNSRQASAES